jgi:ABC-type nitrate/sulfonate/bicarbonate transport system substrate-binding protein
VQRKYPLHTACFAFLLGIVASSSLAFAQQPTKIRMARLAFPSMSSLLLDVLKERGIDKKHDIELETVSQNAVPVYYASIVNGDAELIVGGPHVFQKMILEGAPIKIFATWAPLDVLSVITADPAIKSIADLKGKSIAAAVGSSEYQVTSIYGRKLGLNFGTDVTVVTAAPPLARAQLEAKRVDAAMLWEPTTTLALRDHPEFRVIMSGNAAWKAIANVRGWDLVVAARDDFLKRNAPLVPRLIAMFQDAQKHMKGNLDDADSIVANSLKLPSGTFKAGVESGRLVFDVLPTVGAERDVVWGMLKIAVDTGYLPALPSEDSIYQSQ